MVELLEGGGVPTKGDFVIDTINVGVVAMAEAIIPVIVWFTYEKNRPGMNKLDKATNDWYYISWWTMWIGHLTAFVPPALLWIPSYFSEKAFKSYAYSYVWASVVGGLVALFTWTSLIVSGIEWKDVKEIWVVLLVYTIGNLVAFTTVQGSAWNALKWYIWDLLEEGIEKECGDDQECLDEANEQVAAEMEEGFDTWEF